MDRLKGVDALAERYGMDADTLNFVLIGLQANKGELRETVGKEPDAKQARLLFKSLQGHAIKLMEGLASLPQSMEQSLLLQINEDVLGFSIQSLTDDLDSLIKGIDGVDYQRRKPKGTTTDTQVNDLLIFTFVRLWENQTGRKATYITNAHTDSYRREGEFISFMTDAAGLIGVNPAPLPERFKRLKKKSPAYY